MSGPEITLTGLSASDVVPGNLAEILFAQGPASGGSGVNAILLLGGMLSSSSATPATVYGVGTPIQAATEADYINLFGAGSELHRQFLRVTQVNNSTPLFACPVAEGNSATASNGYLSIVCPTGTAATTTASLRVWIQDQYVDTGIATGDQPFVTGATPAGCIAYNVVQNILGKTRWPVTASYVTAPAWSTGATIFVGMCRTCASGVLVCTGLGASNTGISGVTGASAPTASGLDGSASTGVVWTLYAGATAAAQITLTSKQKGLRANFIRYFQTVSPTTSNVAVGQTASTSMVGGTVADNNKKKC